MADSRYKVRAIGAPFEIQYSSCSDIKPKKFDWCIEPAKWTVHIDSGILYQPDFLSSKDNTFGWICESKEIVPKVYNFILQNYQILFNNYYNKIFTCDISLTNLHPNFVYVPSGSNYPWIKQKDWSLYSDNKQNLCSMFASYKIATRGHEYRHKIAKLALDLGFDVFGGAHGTTRTVTDPKNPWNSKLNGLKSYMFNIVIENANYNDYWTEKLTDCFATGTIPIYWGHSVPKQFDLDGVILLEEGKEKEIFQTINKDLYNLKIKNIKNNLETLSQLKIADDLIFGEIIKNEKT